MAKQVTEEKDIVNGDQYMQMMMANKKSNPAIEEKKDTTSGVVGEDGEEGEVEVEDVSTEGVEATDGVDYSEATEDASEEDDDDLIDLDNLLVDEEDNDGADVHEGQQAQVIKEDYSDFKDLIGKDVQSKNDIKEYLKSLKEKVDSYESQSKETEKLPEALREALEVAAQGGDWQDYLGVSTVDYDTLDPVAMYEESVYAKFGEQHREKAEEYLDSISDAQKFLEGADLKSRLKKQQEDKILSIRNKSSEQTKALRTGINDALKSMDNVSGFKVPPAYKAKAEAMIASGNLDKYVVRDSKGNPDYKETVKRHFVYENFDKIAKYIATNARNTEKRRIISENTNAQVRGKGKSSVQTEGKPSPMDAFLNQTKRRIGINE